MDYQEIIIQHHPGIAVITLNRPAALNALTPLMIRELKQAISAVSVNPEVKVLILKGAGRAFSAGVDLKAMNDGISGGQFTADDILQDGHDIANILRTMPQPTIAAVHGHCYTGATELMMFFDLILAAEDASIGDTHAKWGILPKWGMTQRLPRLVGLLKAKELSFTAKPLSGREAAQLGLANRAVPAEALEQSAMELANDILKNSAQTIAAMKQLYNEGFTRSLVDGLAMERDFNVAITDREEFLKNFSKNK